MGRGNKVTKLTVQEAEDKLRLMLRPWLYQMFQLKNYRGFLAQKRQFFGNHDPKPEETELKFRLAKEVAWLQDQYNRESGFFIGLTRDLTAIIRNTKETSYINKIKLFSRVYLAEYQKAAQSASGSSIPNWITDEDIEDLTKLAVITYLDCWLYKDNRSSLTIDRFCKFGYSESEQEILSDEKKHALHRAYGEYKKMHKKGQQFKKEKSEMTSPSPYKRKHERKLKLFILAWCEAWVSGDIDIVKMFFFQRHLLNRKSEHDARQNEKLYQVLKQYADFVQRTKDRYFNTEKNVAHCKEYVANCILIHQLELSYHFSLAGYIADFASSHEQDKDQYNKKLLNAYISEGQHEEWILLGSSKRLDENGKEKFKKTYSLRRTVGYKPIANLLFTISDNEQIDYLYNKEIFQRYAVENLFQMLLACFPYEQRPWRDDDFIAAAEFLAEDYMFLDNYMEWKPPEATTGKGVKNAKQEAQEKRAQKFYDVYHTFYMQFLKDERTQTKRIISELTK